MLKLKGGYYMIDATPIDLAWDGDGETHIVPGIWNQFDSAVKGGKPAFLFGLKSGTDELMPQPAPIFPINSTKVSVRIKNFSILVSSTDVVNVESE